MSHCIGYRSYHCSVSQKRILADLNEFAYDREERGGYHGNLIFHSDIICKNRDEAEKKIKELDKGWYSDYAVFYREGRKKYWLVKYEYHC